MKKSVIWLALMLVCMWMFPVVSNTASASDKNLKISAKSAYLVDYYSGQVVYEKKADERLPVASMTKLASLAVIFDYMQKGIVKENDEVVVSKTAAAVGGSSAYLDHGSRYKVTDLIKTVIMASANDSTVALAEHIAGTEDVFVSKMNKFVEDLELENTHFSNATGLPCENHYSSAKDMAKIYQTVCDNALYKKYSKIWIDSFMHPSGRKTNLVNTNRLVKTYDGIEGGKTGFTNNARFCLTASAKRRNMRLVGVVIGVDDSKTRFKEMSNLFDYGFSNYKNVNVASAEIPVTIAKFKNAKKQVEVYPKNDLVKFLSKTDENEFSTDYQIFEIKAPIKAETVVGRLYVFDKNNMVVDEIDLILKSDVDEIGFKEKLSKFVKAW